ncbi:hypothetical protein ACOMHN_038882 [Nucella lapillus]
MILGYTTGIVVFTVTLLFITSSESRASRIFRERFRLKASPDVEAPSAWFQSQQPLPPGHQPQGSAPWPDPNTPPVWPNVFQVQFQEIVILGPVTLSKNNGAWFYDFYNVTARFDHNKGQKNNFCQGQGLSPKDPTADCRLLFTKSEDMWVIYPGAQTCCRLCKKGQGCTVLKPDWLSGGRLVETRDIWGRRCAGWAKQGAVAAADTWYQDQQGVPCRYHEVIQHVVHNLTFVPDTYSTRPTPPSVFQVPGYCQKDCPNPYFPPPQA